MNVIAISKGALNAWRRRGEIPIMSNEQHDKLCRMYEIYRDYLKHEDGLINWRLGWNFAIQGFLYAAYGLLMQGLLEHNGNCPEKIPRLLVNIGIPVVGLVLALAGFSGILAALVSIAKLHRDWDECIGQEEAPRPRFPPLTGAGSEVARRIGPWASLGPLAIVCLSWLLLICINGNCVTVVGAFVAVLAAGSFYEQTGVRLSDLK